MAFCKNCGAQIDDNAVVCPACGVQQQPVSTDTGGFGWGLLGFCVPLAGLILYLVWKDEKPLTSKAAGTGALISVIFGIISWLLAAVAGIGAAAVH